MDLQKYWASKHSYYATTEWIDKPSLFAKFAIKYFPKTGKLLDLGAGQGQDSRYFAKKGYEVISTDFSDKALEISRKNTTTAGLTFPIEKLDLGKGKLPYPDQSFEIVYANLSLHYFSDKITSELFAEIHRVLKPKGIFAALFNTIEDPKIKTMTFLRDGLYQNSLGLQKRFFSLDYLKNKIINKFVPLILDDCGPMHDPAKPQKLIRLIGRK